MNGPIHSLAREKARRQLALSSDSPFSQQDEDAIPDHEQSDQAESTASLLEETQEIRNQLDTVKKRMAELREDKENQKLLDTGRRVSLKLRPLTGKTDCPNCSCDRRRSICNQCTSLALRPSQRFFRSKPREASDARTPTAPINRNLVPNQIFTISRSLDNKRTKLAQAIDDLQLTIERMKERGEKLEQERKLVQLYKSQWKFGPSIGGPRASGRDKIGKDQQLQRHQYQSRLDPHFRRDSKSIMGFQHVGSELKLRQYNTGSNVNLAAQPARYRSAPFRSKSLESLNSSRLSLIAKGEAVRRPEGKDELRDRTSSELNLTKDQKPEDRDADELEVAEELEDCLEVEKGSTQNDEPEKVENQSTPSKEEQVQDELENEAGNQRMTWVPVFGETEIKTVKRVPKRKLQIISPSGSASPSSSSVKSRAGQSQVRPSPSPKGPKSILNSRGSQGPAGKNFQDKLLAEAEKKIKFASNLLAQERTDSRTKNQLLVDESAPTPRPRKAPARTSNLNAPAQHVGRPVDKPDRTIEPTELELNRLEEMVNEQQRLLNRLTGSRSNQSSPCCCDCTHRPDSLETGAGAKSLVIALKDRLNKTKLRLTRRLEEERERHQQLQLKVDSSLRKQTDLETENVLLKQSLSKCIDTCLRDISNTFEVIGDTLSSSIGARSMVPNAAANERPTSESLSNAAQLITENRYLKEMQRHVETLEQQRREIFEELSKEKQRAVQLETHLKQSRMQLEQLSATVRDKFNCQDETPSLCAPGESTREQVSSITAGTSQLTDETSTVDDKSRSDETLTLSSADVYRQFIDSISPDMDAIKRERQLLLDEVDNIWKLLSSIEE